MQAFAFLMGIRGTKKHELTLKSIRDFFLKIKNRRSAEKKKRRKVILRNRLVGLYKVEFYFKDGFIIFPAFHNIIIPFFVVPVNCKFKSLFVNFRQCSQIYEEEPLKIHC